MKKGVIILLSVLVLSVIAMAYLNHRNRTLSPPGEASAALGNLEVSLTYSRPSVRDRVVFGEGKDAIQPYGVYWRFGANESTEITFSEGVKFNGVPVSAGTYKIYAYPGKDTFDVRLNKELGTWGYSEADTTLDVIKTSVSVERRESLTEQHTISLIALDDQIVMVMDFEYVHLEIPIEKV